jgi:hypothetical protein
VTGKSNKFFNVTRLRKATLLALFALASMQLVLAGHQFEHSAASAVESCHVCVQADRLDDTVVEHTSFAHIAGEQHSEPQQLTVAFVDDTAYRPFNSRAPPTL